MYYRIYLRIPIVLLGFLICSPDRSANPVATDTYQMLRSGQWETIQQIFRHQMPSEESQKFALARAIERDTSRPTPARSHQALAHYFSILGADCSNRSTEAGFIDCLKGVGSSTARSAISRLTIIYSINLANELNYHNLARHLPSLADLSETDSISARIARDQIKDLLERGQNSAALRISSQYVDLPGGLTKFWFAKAHARANDNQQAVELYLEAASLTNATWILNSIHSDLRRTDASLFTNFDRNHPNRRDLVHLHAQLSTAETQSLVQALGKDSIVRTTNSSRVGSDGMALIKAGLSIDELSAASYTHLSREPVILRNWIDALNSTGKQSESLMLFQRFAHVKAQDRFLWRRLIDLQEDRNQDIFFREMIEYLNHFHFDLAMQDRLIKFLIGEGQNTIEWAEQSYWDTAYREMPRQTGSGRFIYWLKRYYEAHGNETAVQEIVERHYELAPGSFYASAFWDEMEPGDYQQDFSRVRNRSDYLRWISRHGGNEEALRFLSRQSTNRFRDPRAADLMRRIRSTYHTVPQGVIELFRLGELDLANEFFREHFRGRLSSEQNLAKMAYAGRRAENLFISVYYVRSLQRAMNIPEDPFSLPPQILREVYPRPYHDTVLKYSEQYNIEDNMVYSLMHQESMFREQAISRSGARGLMQVMPRTGQWIAEQVNVSNHNLLDPETSIHFGSMYFADLLRLYDHDFRWASIAYNGGRGNLRRWRNQYYNGDLYYFLETLPVEEPRNYCRITYQNYLHYKVTYILHPGNTGQASR